MIRLAFAAFVALWSVGASAQFLIAPSSATANDCAKFSTDRLHIVGSGAPCGTATSVPATGVTSFTANTVLGRASGTGNGQLTDPSAISVTATGGGAKTLANWTVDVPISAAVTGYYYIGPAKALAALVAGVCLVEGHGGLGRGLPISG